MYTDFTLKHNHAHASLLSYGWCTTSVTLDILVTVTFEIQPFHPSHV